MNKRLYVSYKLLVLGVMATLAVVILSSAAVGIILGPYMSGEAQAASLLPTEQTSPSDAEIAAAYERALIDLYAAAVPSVVSIRVTQRIVSHMEPRSQFGFPDSPESPSPREFFNRGQGSGFVWDKEGHIVTNNHVVADASAVEVVFADGKTVKAQVLGRDPNSDLAVIKVDVPAAELEPVTLGDSDNLKVGQLAVAIGSPFGQEFTMTSGIVSALGRTIPSGNSAFSIPEAIQTDAAINPGNSGGPLLDRQGTVIGINTQILSRSGTNDSIGFAVSINTTKLVVPVLINGEEYKYAWLGISGATLAPEVANLMKLPTDSKGALVIAVTQDSPADKAGLKGSDKTAIVEGQEYHHGGDVITAINGEPLEGNDELISYLVRETRPGDTVKLEVIRASGKKETINVTFGVRPRVEELYPFAEDQ